MYAGPTPGLLLLLFGTWHAAVATCRWWWGEGYNGRKWHEIDLDFSYVVIQLAPRGLYVIIFEQGVVK